MNSSTAPKDADTISPLDIGHDRKMPSVFHAAKVPPTRSIKEHTVRAIAYALRHLGARRLAWNILCSHGVSYGGALSPRFLAFLSPLTVGSRVVEHGCGIGTLPEQLPPDSFRSYMGYDIGTAAVRQASSRGLANCSFRACSIESWTGEEEPIDLIICKEVIYYLSPVALRAFIARACEALSPTGKLMMTIHDREKHAETLALCLECGAQEVYVGPPVILMIGRSH